LILKKLTISDTTQIIARAIKILNEARKQDELPIISFDNPTIQYLASLADGDARIALNILEITIGSASEDNNCLTVDKDYVKSVLQRTHMLYDRIGDAHYDTISALHKSVRGSDPDAALFYLGRMLESGEDPLYIARRMVRMASEDIGQADESCLPFAVATYTAVQQVGMPEADCILAHCAVKLAEAKKSVRVYRAYNTVKSMLKSEPGAAAAVVPIHLRNAPTKLMKEIGYGKEYKYNPEFIDGNVNQQYMPEGLEAVKFLSHMHLGTAVDPDYEQ
jgi:putative ATPase